MSSFISLSRLLRLLIALLMGGQTMATAAPALRDPAVLVDLLGRFEITLHLPHRLMEQRA